MEETAVIFFVADLPRHRLRTEAFFDWNPDVLGLGRQIGPINSGANIAVPSIYKEVHA
jgi:hypothetical protein